MTAEEFYVLKAAELIGETQGLMPRGTPVKHIKQVLYDEGYGDLESHQITTLLVALRRRKLVLSKPGSDGALWLCTIYGRNVVSA
jgi:hypothetical protein